MKRMRNILIISTLLVGLTACGDDDEGGSDDTESTEAGGESDGGSDSANADVQEYCDQVDDLAEELKEVLADPSSGDVTALTTQATELVTAAQQLISTNADDVDEINACSQRLTAAITGG